MIVFALPGMRTPRIPIALALVMMLISAVPVLCLTFSTDSAVQLNEPPTPGGCHGHQHSIPHIPQTQHLCCYSGHQVPAAAVRSISIVPLLNVMRCRHARPSAAEFDTLVESESVVAWSPPFRNQILRI
jgi:hypothetical protein